MSRVAARPAAAPPRPAAPPTAGKAQAPVAAPAAPVAPDASANVPNAVGTETVAAPEAPKKRGRKKGSGAAAKSEKTLYPGLLEVGADGNYVMVAAEDGSESPKRIKLTAIPTDFDAKKFDKLKPSDFADEAMYYDFRAAELRKQADAMEKTGKRLKALGGLADKKKASKLLKMREQLAALQSQLKQELGDDQFNDLLGEDIDESAE